MVTAPTFALDQPVELLESHRDLGLAGYALGRVELGTMGRGPAMGSGWLQVRRLYAIQLGQLLVRWMTQALHGLIDLLTSIVLLFASATLLVDNARRFLGEHAYPRFALAHRCFRLGCFESLRSSWTLLRCISLWAKLMLGWVCEVGVRSMDEWMISKKIMSYEYFVSKYYATVSTGHNITAELVNINDNHSNARWANQIGLARLRIKWFTLIISNTHLSLCTDDVIAESVIRFCFVATSSGSKCSSCAPEYLSRLMERLVLGREKGKIWKMWNNIID